MQVESFGGLAGDDGEADSGGARVRGPRHPAPGPLGWLDRTNHSPGLGEALRGVRRALPGDLAMYRRRQAEATDDDDRL